MIAFSGPEDLDGRYPQDQQRLRHRNDSVSINDSLRSQRGGCGFCFSWVLIELLIRVSSCQLFGYVHCVINGVI